MMRVTSLAVALALAGTGAGAAEGEKMPNPQFRALVAAELRGELLLDDVDVSRLNLSQLAAIHHLLTQGTDEHNFLRRRQRILAIARRD